MKTPEETRRRFVRKLAGVPSGGRRSGAVWGLAAIVGLLVGGQVADASARLSEAAALALEAKITELSEPPAANPSRARAVVISEVEANSYLKFRGGEFLPQGILEPTLHIAPDVVSATATVDFDELGRQDPSDQGLSSKAFAMVFRGRQPVVAAGRLETGNGQGKLRIESLTVGTTRFPPAFVQFLAETYIERRYGLDLSKPFPLPEGVSHIELGRGRATFHRAAQSAAR